jgi:small-conductance mechanosensitive channel
MRVSLGLITPQAGPQIGGVERTTATLITTLIIILWIVFGIRASTLFISWMSRHRRRFQMVQSTSQPLFEVAAKLILVGLAVYLVLIAWDKDPAAWLASAGILALALGLAAQETLSNLFGGISILADSSFKVGDYIVIDRVDRGRVTRIGLRSTRILTRDDIEITVPNSLIASSKILNESGGPYVKHRVRIPVSVAYGSDVDRVREIAIQSIDGIEDVCDSPPPTIRFLRMGESSLDFELRCWVVEPEARGRVIDRINMGCYRALRKAGVEIPYPKRDLYVRAIPGG